MTLCKDIVKIERR